MSITSTGLSDYEFGPLVVRPKKAAAMLACGITQLYVLINRGDLKSFLDGHARKITVESIRRYIAKQLAASNSGDEPNKLHGKIRPATVASLATRRARRAKPAVKIGPSVE
jgi:hypothetical protein